MEKSSRLRDFNNHGFLGSEIDHIRTAIISENKTAFDYAKRLNQVVQKEKDRFPLYPNQRDAVIGSLLCKVITSYQTVVLVMSYGLPNEASVILRSMMESVFLLMANCHDVSFHDHYLKSHHFERLRFAKKIIKEIPSFDISPAFSEEEMRDIAGCYEEYKKYKLPVWEIAQKVGMEEYYIKIYWNLSLDVHSSPRSTEQYIRFEEDSGKYSLDIIPKITMKQVSLDILLCADLLIKSFESLYDHFAITPSEDFISIKNDLDKLV